MQYSDRCLLESADIDTYLVYVSSLFSLSPYIVYFTFQRQSFFNAIKYMYKYVYFRKNAIAWW